MKALILAAGLGTRLKPITNRKPKALVEINGIPILEITISRLIKFGFEEIIINVHHFADQIIDFLIVNDNFGIDIIISDEKKLLLDTGGGLKKTSWFFNDNGPFLVHNVDVLSDIDLRSLCDNFSQSNSIAELAVQNRKSSRYFLFDEDKNLCGWKNEKTDKKIISRDPTGALTKMAFCGIQIVDPKIFGLMPDKDIFSLVDLYLSIASKYSVIYHDYSDSTFLDIGKKENLSEAKNLINKIL
jgi:NDP-sugar pyrophosphorylase family protein